MGFLWILDSLDTSVGWVRKFRPAAYPLEAVEGVEV